MGTKNITYLLGAGASANALPIINNLNARLSQFLYFLGGITNTLELNSERVTIQNKIKDYYSLLKWLRDESKFHQSIDTFAKKLFLTDKLAFIKLKKALIFYFILEQCVKLDELKYYDSDKIPKEFKNESLINVNEEQLDKRYDNLIASLLNKNGEGIEINPRIKILTWNYDMQIELAFKRYFQTNIEGVKGTVNIFPSKLWNMKETNGLITEDKFTLIKLNGEAYISEDLNYFPESKDSIIDKIQFGKGNFFENVGFIVENMNAIEKNKTSFILNLDNFTFAWEENKPNGYNKAFKYVQSISEKTNILIVIGYSFPYFNSEIDKKILENMKPQEIIIQDFDSETIEERIKELSPKFSGPFTSENRKPIIKHSKPGNYFYIHSDT